MYLLGGTQNPGEVAPARGQTTVNLVSVAVTHSRSLSTFQVISSLLQLEKPRQSSQPTPHTTLPQGDDKSFKTSDL